MINVTLRNLTVAKLALLASVLEDAGLWDLHVQNAGHQTPSLLDAVLPKTPTIDAVGVGAYGNATFAPAPDYSDQLAASIFGGGGLPVAPQVPNVPPATPPLGHQQPAAPGVGATIPPSVSPPPVASAVSGTQGGAVVLDSKGRPWDKRIHGSGKQFLAKGSATQAAGEWKLARNMDPAYVAQVNAELDAHKHHVHSGQPLAAEVTPAITRFNDVVVVPPAAAPGGYTPPATYAPVTDEFSQLRDKVLNAVAAKKIAPVVVGQMLNHFGIISIEDLANHPTQWPTISSEIDRLSAGAA